MATIAVVGALRMPSTLARGYIAVMAENALLGGLVMRKRCYHRSPGVSGMAGIAQVAGQWMITRFERARAYSIVTSGAGTGLSGHRGMIEHNTQPSIGVMATVARCGGRNVSRPFTGGNVAVMATVTRRSGLRVIDRLLQGSPAGSGDVATVAVIGA
jgi:hypothetical protein